MPVGPLNYKLTIGNGGAHIYLERIADSDATWAVRPYDNAGLNTSGKMWPDQDEDLEKWEPVFAEERLVILDVAAQIPRIGMFNGANFYDYGVLRPTQLDPDGADLPYAAKISQLLSFVGPIQDSGAPPSRVLVPGGDPRVVGLIRGEGLVLEPGMTQHLCPSDWVVVDESPP
jgi:hypothetical protein